MAKKNKIPKNRSINEMLGQKQQKIDEETITMEEVIAKMDRKKQEKQEKSKQERKQFNKKIQDMARRKDYRFAEDKRKEQYIKAVNTVRGFEEQPIEERMLLLTEEIGELAKSIRKNATNMSTDVNKQYSYDSIESEVSDCLYVLASVCNKLDIDMFKCLKEKEKENIHRVWKK